MICMHAHKHNNGQRGKSKEAMRLDRASALLYAVAVGCIMDAGKTVRVIGYLMNSLT